MEREALFFFPLLDFRRSPGSITWAGVLFGPGVDVDDLRTELPQRYPDLLPVEHIFPFEVLLPPDRRAKVGGGFPFFLPVSSASSGDQLRRDLCAVPGIVDILVGFPTRNTAVARGFDVRIESAIERLESRSRRVVASRKRGRNRPGLPNGAPKLKSRRGNSTPTFETASGRPVASRAAS